jgi:hypothetical protein
MKNVETDSAENSTKTAETNESPDKVRPHPIVLTSEANLVNLQRKLKSVVSWKFFFRNSATGTQFTVKSMVDCSAIRKFLTEKNLRFFTYYTYADNEPVESISGIFLAISMQRIGSQEDRLRRHQCKTDDCLTSHSRKRGHTHLPLPLPSYASKESKSSRNLKIDCQRHIRVRVKSELLYDWRFTSNEFFLTTSPLKLTTSNFIFQLNTCSCNPYVTSSPTRVLFMSEFHGNHDHILPSQIRDSPNLEDQVPVFISPRKRVTRL